LDPDFGHALKLTLMLAAVAVPLNSIFGVLAAVLITRNEFPGKVRGRPEGRWHHDVLCYHLGLQGVYCRGAAIDN
jgi:hypothetical protein